MRAGTGASGAAATCSGSRSTSRSPRAAHEGLSPEELIALDAALDRLAAIDPREARVVELRFFVGLGNEEIAQVLEVSVRSVARDWMHARSWLRRELAVASQGVPGSGGSPS